MVGVLSLGLTLRIVRPKAPRDHDAGGHAGATDAAGRSVGVQQLESGPQRRRIEALGLRESLMNDIEMSEIFGWNIRAWSRPFLSAIEDFPVPESADILELGAGSYSAVSLYFLGKSSQLAITTYPEDLVPGLRKLVARHCDADAGSPRIACMSAMDVSGSYDLVLMKSVLGGLFRQGSSSGDDVNALISGIVERNVRPGGALITLDNGATVIEPLFSRFGARANRWRYFVPSDFKGYTRQYGFGLFSSFSLVTRFGKLGKLAENFFYWLDRLIFALFRISRPSVIVTLYKKPA